MSVDGDYERRLDIRRSMLQEEIRGREMKLRELSTTLRSEERRAHAQHESFRQVYQKIKTVPTSAAPAERLQRSMQLVTKLRDRKTHLRELEGRIEQLAEERSGVVSEIACAERKAEKIGILRAQYLTGREHARAEQAAEELIDLVAAAREEGEGGEADPALDETTSFALLSTDAARDLAFPSVDAPVLSANSLCAADAVSDQGARQQHRGFADSGGSPEGPHHEPATTRFAELQGRIQDLEQWKRLGSEGLSVQYVSAAGGAYEVSVVARAGQDLDIAVHAARSGDARTLRLARDEIQELMRKAGLKLRTLEVR